MPSGATITRSRTAVARCGLLKASSASVATIAGSACIGAEVGSANDMCECDKALEWCTRALEEGPTTAWEAPKGNGCKAVSPASGKGRVGCAIAKLENC